MALNDRTYSFDINLQVGDGVAAQAASGFAQNGGANGILDLGGNLGVSPQQQQRTDAVMVVDISAMNSAGTYVFSVVGSNSPSLGAGNVVLGAVMGGTLTIPTPLAPPAVPGRLEILFTNNQMGALYEYIGLHVAVTAGSVQYKAFMAVLPRI